ncbi:MAG TPA: LLM class flavin-dependent oxidoreductase, partial [Thermoanaerobaculia bacterium]|nr:LLM class flavin-dependent oxidoreductase [Thermoanaerobaculia bacterium]
WRLPQRGEGDAGTTRTAQIESVDVGVPDLEQQVAFAREAEESGIDSLLVDYSYIKPDSIVLSTALGLHTTSVKYIIAYRSGIMSPTAFVQQLNTLSTLIGGRLSVNVVAGYSPEEQRRYGDFLSHDERYARTEEFLAVCNGLWGGGEVDYDGRYYRIQKGALRTPFLAPDRSSPELYVAGNSAQARALAIAQGTCWMMMAEAPEKIRASAAEVLAAGRTIGVRMGMIVRRTRAEALDAARAMVAQAEANRASERSFVQKSDAVCLNRTFEEAENEWLAPHLWTGAVRAFGSTAIALVGSAEDVAEGLLSFRNAGVTQFILSGWPKLETMRFFAREVLPIVREREAVACASF